MLELYLISIFSQCYMLQLKPLNQWVSSNRYFYCGWWPVTITLAPHYVVAFLSGSVTALFRFQAHCLRLHNLSSNFKRCAPFLCICSISSVKYPIKIHRNGRIYMSMVIWYVSVIAMVNIHSNSKMTPLKRDKIYAWFISISSAKLNFWGFLRCCALLIVGQLEPVRAQSITPTSTPSIRVNTTSTSR